jgi:DNA gyrase/topoisomerase IV subunit A
MDEDVPPDILELQAAVRAHILDGYIAAFDRQAEISRMVWSCETSAEAVTRLTGEPFDFSEVQAHHILDRPLRWQTKEQLRALVAEREALRLD